MEKQEEERGIQRALSLRHTYMQSQLSEMMLLFFLKVHFIYMDNSWMHTHKHGYILECDILHLNKLA